MSGKPRGLVGLTQIKNWEREHAALTRQARKLEERRESIKALIDAAKKVARETPAEAAPARRRKTTTTRRARNVEPVAPPAAPSQAAPAAAPPKKQKRGKTSEWKSIILEIALTSSKPVTYDEARAEIMKTPLAEKLQRSEKGFYHTISRLSKAKEIIAYKGHLFSPELFEKFKADRDAGLVRDLKIPNAAHHSPMGEAVAEMMQSRPNGAESGHIIWALRQKPEFAEIIAKNKTHPYNVLARLVRTGELTKKGKRYYSASLKKEAPTAAAEGASIDTGQGESGPPSLFAQNGESRSG